MPVTLDIQGKENASAAIDKVANELTHLSAVAKTTTTDLAASFARGEISVDQFNDGVRAAEAPLHSYTAAAETLSRTVDDDREAHGRLSTALGVSRQQLGGLIQTTGQAIGVNNSFLSGISAITSDLGPLGIGLSLATVAVKEYIDWLDKAAKKEVELAELRTKFGQARSSAQSAADIASQTEALTQKIDAQSKQLAALESALGSSDKRTRDYAAAQIEAAGGIDKMRLALDALILARDRLTSKHDDVDHMDELATGSFRAAEGMERAADGTWRAVDALGALSAAAGGFDVANWSAGIDKLKDLKEQMRGDATGGDLVTQAGAVGTAVTATYVATGDAFSAQEQRKRDEARRTADEQKRLAESAAKAEAASQSRLTETVKEASQVLTAAQQANVQAILNTSASAEEKLRMLMAYLNSLPTSKDINILLTFGGNLDLAKALGLMGAGGPPTGNQQGPQALFEFIGESAKTQTAEINAHNGDVAAATRDWTAKHLKEVQQDIADGFDATGRKLSALEIAKEKAHIKGANDPFNSSHDPFAANSDDPRYRPPKYGTDPGTYYGSDDKLPPGYLPHPLANTNAIGAPAKGVGGAGGPAQPMIFYVTVNDKIDIEELALRVFQIANRNGR